MPGPDSSSPVNVAVDPCIADLQRSHGVARLAWKTRHKDTVVDALYQAGCAKLRLPATEGLTGALLLNTAGGLTDGDRFDTTIRWRPHTRACVTTQAAERIYRSRGGAARVASNLDVEGDAAAVWLPQPTILFDGAHLERHTTIRLHPGARLVFAESLVFGRLAMGEAFEAGRVIDRYRLSVGDRLVLHDALRLDGADAPVQSGMLDRGAVANGCRAIATMLIVSPDARRLVDPLRQIIADCDVAGGASDLGEVVCVRLIAATAKQSEHALRRLIDALAAEMADLLLSVPRTWDC